MQGYIKIHRQLLGSPVFDNPELLKVWIWCLLKASHKEHIQLVGLQEQLLLPGQFIFGRIKAAQELKLSESKIFRLIKKLEKMQNIHIKSNNKYSVVTIVNWGLYQGNGMESEQQTEQQMNNKRTTNEQQMNTNKNDKNVKKDKKDINSDFINTIISLYPGKKVKAVRDNKLPNILKKYSEDEILRAVKRYAVEVDGKSQQYILNESTFWNGRYEDYLDSNYANQVTQHERVGVPPSESVLGKREESWF